METMDTDNHGTMSVSTFVPLLYVPLFAFVTESVIQAFPNCAYSASCYVLVTRDVLISMYALFAVSYFFLGKRSLVFFPLTVVSVPLMYEIVTQSSYPMFHSLLLTVCCAFHSAVILWFLRVIDHPFPPQKFVTVSGLVNELTGDVSDSDDVSSEFDEDDVNSTVKSEK